ncbi:hypothetical protein GJ699_14840 [Duganella sp. FT80W]|uniref:Uncharacterized protein n=1 Tax=Duganella guangzhouensis TaxID=2666084 RepID=A0A6I2KZA0_9BURK|nr:hypothetical protein [Duganella guangzhouensis]MRW91268.1 hypothetical protein [Duganella guangzhouensis]
MNKTRQYAIALCLFSLSACADRINNDSPSASAMTGGGMGGTSRQASASYGVVQAIDQMQRQDMGAMGSVGAAAAGGGASGSPTDKVYRVTVRMDDGSTQLVVLESQPGYKIGDRVRYSNGSVQAY